MCCILDQYQYVANHAQWLDPTRCCTVRSKPYLSDFSSSEGPGSGTIEVNPGGIMCPPFVVKYNSVRSTHPSLPFACMPAAQLICLDGSAIYALYSSSCIGTPMLHHCFYTKPCMVTVCCQDRQPG